MQIIFFKLKEILICETKHITGIQNFMAHSQVYGAR